MTPVKRLSRFERNFNAARSLKSPFAVLPIALASTLLLTTHSVSNPIDCCKLLQKNKYHNPWNSPYSKENCCKRLNNTAYTAFQGSPKTLDPARSYSADESLFTGQIYEPPLQYHYLKRPYTLIPLTAQKVPSIQYLDKQLHPLSATTAKTQKNTYIAYDIYIKPHIYYQPHPAFAKNHRGAYRYHHLNAKTAAQLYTLNDFTYTDTRELTAEDYVYQIKRLAHPSLSSPILGLMSSHILGMKDFARTLAQRYDRLKQSSFLQKTYIDLRKIPLKGVQLISRYHYRIIVTAPYPQLLYWLTMSFFAPIPWEADRFYSQAALQRKNITLDWYPIGTGPYQLVENNPNRRMVLARNPHFHPEYYPKDGEKTDKAAGYLKDRGKRLPFIERWMFSLDKEAIPRWYKFLQGYYDQSTVASDQFDQAVQIDEKGHAQLTPALKKKRLRLQSSITPSIFYTGFNMLDPVVGGYTERARKLRQAISIAFNYESFINIFLSGQGIAAQGPLPPNIFGQLPGRAGMNPYIYQWQKNKKVRKSLATAKHLLSEAGYPNGRNIKTGKPLILYYDTTAFSSPDDKARFDWLRQQMHKIGIQLVIRATQYNRFQQKVRTGHVQLFSYGWLGDYPDPENFLFLLYGPNGSVKHYGPNHTNYKNSVYDKLFNQMKAMPNGPKRLKIIQKMLDILRADSPWIWGFHPKNYRLSHVWRYPTKPNELAKNLAKYTRLDTNTRAAYRIVWNQPKIDCLWILVSLTLSLLLLPTGIKYYLQQSKPVCKRLEAAANNTAQSHS